MMTGKDLQTWRKSRGFSVAQIADLLGVSPRTVEGWESAGNPIPERRQQRIADIMRQETLALRINRDTYAKLSEVAKAKGYASADAYANDLLGKLFLIVGAGIAFFLYSGKTLAALHSVAGWF